MYTVVAAAAAAAADVADVAADVVAWRTTKDPADDSAAIEEQTMTP